MFKKIIIWIIILTVSLFILQVVSAQENAAKNFSGEDDNDNDGLTNIEEDWWHCDKNNNDTNDDGVKDGPSVDYTNPKRTYPYKGKLDSTADKDSDGLPDRAENEDPRLKTDSGEFSTDGDPYGDGDEYFGIGIPEISPADHPLVAAYPNLKVVLSRIQYKPTGEITTTSGISNQSSWSAETGNSISSTNTEEWGTEASATVEASTTGVSGSATISGHYTNTKEDETQQSVTQSTSGFSENDWSTADTINKERAAIITLIFNVENIGTAPAQNIKPQVNLKLGDQEIATIGVLNTITSLPAGSTSKNLAVNKDENGDEIALSLDELKSVERGSPLNIETFEINANAKKWDNNRNEWVLIDQDFSLYMDEINKKTATLIFEREDGTWREYKVAVVKDLTLGDAFNLTVGSDINISNTDLGFPIDAQASIMELAEDKKPDDETATGETTSNKITINKLSISSLKLKPGWIISVRPLRVDLKINWASYDKNKKEISASVIGRNEIKNVLAHIKMGDRYENLSMTSPDKNTIYLLKSNMQFEIDENCYLIVTDIGNNTVYKSLLKPTKLSLKNGRYLIIANSSEMAMKCAGENEGYNAVQDDCFGDLSQMWYLRYIRNGAYSIQNGNYSDYYLEVDEGKTEEGANVQGGMFDEGAPSQQWYVERDGKGNYAIVASHSGKYLTVKGIDKGASIVQESNQQKPNQEWIVQPVDSYPFNLLAVSKGLMDQSLVLTGNNFLIASGPSNKGSLLGIYGNNFTAAPEIVGSTAPNWTLWKLWPTGDGYFALMSNNKCLQVATSNLSDKSNGIEVNAGDCKGLDNQKWRFKHIGGDQYAICVKYSNKCLDIISRQQWEYQGNKSQRFRVITPPITKQLPEREGSTSYWITVHTGTGSSPANILDGGGTSGDVKLTLYGEYGEVSTGSLDNPGADDFIKGTSSTFRLNDVKDVGNISKIEIHFDEKGSYPDWRVDWIRIQNTKTAKTYVFEIFNWLERSGTFGYYLTRTE